MSVLRIKGREGHAMTPAKPEERLNGSIEGSLRSQPGADPKPRPAPGNAPQPEATDEPPMVLYGRLGYIPRDPAQRTDQRG